MADEKSNKESRTQIIDMDKFLPSSEIRSRFIKEVYGIYWDNIPKIYQVKDVKNNQVFEFKNKKEAEVKFQELRNVEETMVATEDFKKYLKRLRESNSV